MSLRILNHLAFAGAVLAHSLAVLNPAAAGATDRVCFGQPATLIGTPGDDVIRGTDFDDVVVALGGNDVVRTGGGNDLVCAGAGNDLVRTGPFNDRVRGAAGDDDIHLGTSYFIIPGYVPPSEAYGGKGRDLLTTTIDGSLFGGPGSDTLTGGRSGNSLLGGPGNDLIDGNGGSDSLLFGRRTRGVTVRLDLHRARGQGTDEIHDVENVYGTPFADRISGDGRRNAFHSFGGNDILRGRGGNDQLTAGRDRDDISGGDGDDFLWGDAGADVMRGGPGSDYTALISKGIGVQVDLGQGTSLGSDREIVIGVEDVRTTRFADVVIGNGKANVIDVLGGDDIIRSKAGDDKVKVGRGANEVYGGPGTDLVSYDQRVEADLSLDTASHGRATDVLDSIESLRSGYGNDRLIGDDTANYLEGGPGDDFIDGGPGDDRIRGGLIKVIGPCNTDAIPIFTDGSDELHGGDGDDTIAGGIRVRTIGGGIRVKKAVYCGGAEDAGDRIFGEEGDDNLFGQQGDDELDGGPGIDSLDGGGDTDSCLSGETRLRCE